MNQSLDQSRALAWIRQQNWAIEPSALEVIVAIASRELSNPEFAAIDALSSRGGTPLEGARKVTMREGGIALVDINGPIFRYASWFHSISGATSIERVALDFTTALNSKNVNAIVLTVDSPGGEVSGIHEFARMVQAARGKKAVTAYISDKAASAAYWIAAAAERIVLDATASVGSIGVVARVIKSGNRDVVEVVSKQSPNKRPDVETEHGRAQLQAHVDRIAQIFVDNVAEFRGVSTENVLAKFGRGGLLVGSDAVAAGMADSLGSLEGLVSTMGSAARRVPAAGTLHSVAAKPTPLQDYVYSFKTSGELRTALESLGVSIDSRTADYLHDRSVPLSPLKLSLFARVHLARESRAGRHLHAAQACDVISKEFEGL